MMYTPIKTSVLSLMLMLLAACSGEQAGVDVSNTSSNGNIPPAAIQGIQTEYDASQVNLGRDLYEAQCQSCHGSKDEAGPYGGYFLEGSSLTSAQEYIDYVTDLMPLSQPQVCGNDCSEAVLAYAVTEFLKDSPDNTDSLDNTDIPIIPDNTDSPSNTDNTNNAEGKALYGAQCSACHGQDGEGGAFSEFFIAQSAINTDQAMINYIAENMPLGTAATCDTDCSEKILNYAKLNFANYYGVIGNTDTGSPAVPEAPEAPSLLVASLAVSNDMINVFWNDNSDNEEGFTLQRKVDSGAWSTIAVTSINVNIYVDSNINAGKTYHYRVRSFKGALSSVNAISAIINVKEAVVQTLPVAPSQLAAQLVENGIKLTWNDNSNNESGFTLERRVQSGSWSQLAVLAMNVTQYQNLALLAGTVYEYRMNAFNEAGDSQSINVTAEKTPEKVTEEACLEPQYVAGTSYSAGQNVFNDGAIYQCKIGGWCSSASAFHYEPGNGLAWQDAWSRLSNASCGDGGAVSIPASASNAASVVNAGLTSINISWSDVADDESGYKIQRKQNSNSWLALSELSENTSIYTDTNVQAGNTYQYRIAAFNASGTSNWLTTLALVLEAEQSLPSVVTNIVALLNNSKTAIDLTWNDQADNESGFKIERKVNSGNWVLQSSKAANTSSYSDGLISAGSNYQYRVAPFNELGTTSYVESITINVAAENESEDKLAFESNCTGCHNASGSIGGDLLDSRMVTIWQQKSFDQLFDKVKTMTTFNCDDACKERAAKYLWLEAWGLEIDIIVVANGRGVRGIRLLTPLEYQKTVLQLTGIKLIDAELPSDNFDTEFKYPTQADTGVVLYDGMKKYLSLAEKVAGSVNLTALGCGSTSCTSAQIDTLGFKMHRRPLTTAEKTDYANLNTTDGSRAMFTSMLMSPNFLYKMEMGAWNAGENAYELNDYELASSLAFMIWGVAPDDALLAIAQNGGLSSDEQVATVVSNMMNDARFANNMSTFIKYYTHSYQEATEKPGLTNAVISSMYDEQAGFVDYWLNQDDASFNKLFNPGYTFVDSTLAQHYGMSVSQSSLHKVATTRNRGGVLHQGLTQIMNSDFAATSLVRRGKMIRENLMCHKMGVPSGVDPSTIQLPTTPITTRERWNFITGPDASEGQCWECHQLMNEQGSSLEQFDAAGRYRITELDYNGSSAELILDVTGTLRDNSSDPLMQFDDARELTEYLGSSNLARACFADSFTRYATGHESDGYNKEELDGLKAKFDQDDNVRSMILWMAQSAMMRYRVER
jgi:mono/diheme cytochrome c family protein/fibronectin type 3 domain-containing protein